jgi:Fe-S cluster assembly ATP-binding protein
MLKIKDLKIWVWNKEILKWISLDFELGKNYLILWKNGSWKSSLVNFLMWNPNYEWIEWSIEIDTPLSQKGKDQDFPLDKGGQGGFLALSPDQRSKAWLFLSFQNVPEIEGIKLSEYLRIIYNIHLKNKNPETRDISPFIFRKFVKRFLEELNIPESFLDRDLNVWFSWWEKRKIEILQMKLIEPSYIILDEIDSWLDVDAFKTIANLLKTMSNEHNTFIIITHQFKILDYLDIDWVYVMREGEIAEKWGKELVKRIGEEGFG